MVLSKQEPKAEQGDSVLVGTETNHVRLPPHKRLVILRALLLYAQTNFKDGKDSIEAVNACMLARSIALRPKGRAPFHPPEWYFWGEEPKALKEIEGWIAELKQKLSASPAA